MLFLEHARESQIRIAISRAIVDEIVEVLRDKFGYSEVDLMEVESWLQEFTYMVSPIRTVDVVKDDPDDNRIVECAIASGSTMIVTGDKDLLRLGNIEGIEVLTVSQYLR